MEVVETRVIAAREVVGPPKTTSGARLLGLDASTVAVLCEWRLRLHQERLAAEPVGLTGAGCSWTSWALPRIPSR